MNHFHNIQITWNNNPPIYASFPKNPKDLRAARGCLEWGCSDCLIYETGKREKKTFQHNRWNTIQLNYFNEVFTWLLIFSFLFVISDITSVASIKMRSFLPNIVANFELNSLACLKSLCCAVSKVFKVISSICRLTLWFNSSTCE